MRLRKRLWLVLIFAAFVATPAQSALAQGWLEGRDQEEGTGIRVGDLEFHPGIALLGGYDSNPYYRDPDDRIVENLDGTAQVTEGVVGSAMAQVTPHLDISTISARRRADGDEVVAPPFIDFRAGLSASFYYLGYTGSVTDRNEANIDLRETFNPERPFSVHLLQEYGRRWIPLAGIVSTQNHFGLGVRPEFSTPGGLLRGSLGYKFNYDHFDSDRRNNNLVHSVGQQMNWEFLPKTALFEELTLDLQNFTRNSGVQVTDKNDSVRLTGRAGLNGALTKTIAVTISAGLTNAFVDNTDDAKDLVAQAQVRWRPTQAFSLTLSGRRTGENALQGNTLTRTGAGLEANLIVGGVFLLGAEAKVETLEFGDDRQQLALKGLPLMIEPEQSAIEELALSTDPRSDLRVNIDLNAEYRFTSWLAVTGEFSYFLNDTDYAFVAQLPAVPATGTPAQLRANPAGFEAFRLLAGLRAFL